MLPPPLPGTLSVSVKKIHWPWMFSSAVQGQVVTVSGAAQEWRVKSAPWWLEVQREGNQLLLTPKNCGFLSGKVVLQPVGKSVAIPVSAWILPNVGTALRGVAVGGVATAVPITGAAILIVLGLLLGAFLFLASIYMGGLLGVVPPAMVAALLMLGPIPIGLGCVWGACLRSWQTWLRAASGTILGAVLALLVFHFVHGCFGSNPPSMSALFMEISVVALVWVGSVAMCTAGWRMILVSVPVVLAATALMLAWGGDFAREAFTDLEQPFREANAWNKIPVNKESPAEVFRVFSPAPGIFRTFGWTVYASLFVQVVFVIALPLLTMFVAPLRKAVPPSLPTRKVEHLEWRNGPRVVPPAWRKLRL